MSKSTMNFLLWLLGLLIVGLFSHFMAQDPLIETVQVGPHNTYTWYYESRSMLLGDGQTQVFLKSTSGNNFAVKDQVDLYITGKPAEMLPGDTLQAFIADFQLAKDNKYDLRDSSVEIYTLVPTTLTFESFRYGYAWLGWICAMLFIISVAFKY